jgi:flagellar basal-body rod modification protein FlgD
MVEINPFSALSKIGQANQDRSTIAGNFDTFLKLLTTQLQNQNPMDPMSNEKFVSQMAQLTSLEQMTKMTDAFQSMNQSAQARQYLSVLGEEVNLTRSGGDQIKGTVESIKFGDGETLVSIGGKQIPTNEILAIGIPGDSGDSSSEAS